MPNVKNNASTQETCRRLIDAAGQVFAERGLHAATVKEITERAGVNTAAINYHFNDKQELYTEVIRHALSQTPMIREAELGGTPEERLRTFISEVIADLFDPERPSWRATVVAHEFIQPTGALDAVLDDLIRPRAQLLHDLVRELVGDGPDEFAIACARFSVAAQCFFYLYNRELLKRLSPELSAPENSAELAERIADFSLAGLKALARGDAKSAE
ncbi:MAG TPA: CerR family C-terminal domain-containing protein [Phycisphaerae bacterium]|nr:CerR family C-terminal domain-containing protein [Phycisphaerales bacterium]HRX85004.1 CerR family C-terminal domain-containing protein [Phycisphaerae bacterium]